jgi:hypothetical protein
MYVAWLRDPAHGVDQVPPFARTHLCAPLLRMATAVAALGPVGRGDVDGQQGGVAPAVPLGPWVVHAPLWGNPYLCLEDGAPPPADVDANLAQLAGPQRVRLAEHAGLTTLVTLRDAVRDTQPGPARPPMAQREDVGVLSQQLRQQQQLRWNVQRILSSVGVGGFSLMDHALAVPHLWRAVPGEWREAAAAAWPARAGAQAPSEAAAGTPEGALWRVWQGWGWRLPRPEQPAPPVALAPAQPAGRAPQLRAQRQVKQPRSIPVLGQGATVKDLTRLLTSGFEQARRERHCAYVADARGPGAGAPDVADVPAGVVAAAGAGAAAGGAPGAGVAAGDGVAQGGGRAVGVELGALHTHFAAVWRLPCDNRLKEPLWRVAVNGVPGAGGMDICFSGPCACGVARVATVARRGPVEGARKLRQHVFWECPVAWAVIQEVEAGLPRGTRLQRHHVWLGVAPCDAVRLAVWRVVCVAALGAMDKGRRCLWCFHHEQQEQQAFATGQAPVLRQLTLWQAWGVPPAAEAEDGVPQPLLVQQTVPPVLRAQRAAVQDFWARLQQFVASLPPVPPPRPGARAHGGHPRWGGSAAVGEAHPFIRRVGQAVPPQYEVVLPEQAAAAIVRVPVPEEPEAE